MTYLLPQDDAGRRDQKRAKLERIRPLLDRPPPAESATCFDFLTPDLREKFHIIDTANVSAHGYDPYALAIINENPHGLVLDCGAGSRSDYLPNVINYEIVDYPSTDIRGVAEELPFRDGSIDGVLCLNVLEHVKDPFRAACEIARVMKPGAHLYCVVPFLQPLHAYPHHYYNMSAEGLRNLFDSALVVDRQEVIGSGLPVWTLSWFLGSWANGLPVEVRERFLQMRVSDLIADPLLQLETDYVKALPTEKNYELASTTAIFAHKA